MKAELKTAAGAIPATNVDTQDTTIQPEINGLPALWGTVTYHVLAVNAKGILTFDGKRISKENAAAEVASAQNYGRGKKYKDIPAILFADKDASHYLSESGKVHYRRIYEEGNLKLVDFGRDDIPYINKKVAAIIAYYQRQAEKEDEQKALEIAYKASPEYKLEEIEQTLADYEYEIAYKKRRIADCHANIMGYLGYIAYIEDTIQEHGLAIDNLNAGLAAVQADKKKVTDEIATREAFNKIRELAINDADDGSNDDPDEPTFLDKLDTSVDKVDVDVAEDELVDEPLPYKFEVGKTYHEHFFTDDCVEISNYYEVTRRTKRAVTLKSEDGTEFKCKVKINDEKDEFIDEVILSAFDALPCTLAELFGDDNAASEEIAPIDTQDTVQVDNVIAKFEIDKVYYGEYSTVSFSGASTVIRKRYFKIEKRTPHFVTINGRRSRIVYDTDKGEMTIYALGRSAASKIIIWANNLVTDEVAINGQVPEGKITNVTNTPVHAHEETEEFAAESLLQYVNQTELVPAIAPLTFDLQQFNDSAEIVIAGGTATIDTAVTEVTLPDEDAAFNKKVKELSAKYRAKQAEVVDLSAQIRALVVKRDEKQLELCDIKKEFFNNLDYLRQFMKETVKFKKRGIAGAMINIVTQADRKRTWNAKRFANVYIEPDATNGAIQIIYYGIDFDERVAKYYSAETFKAAITALAQAIQRGDTDFTFPDDSDFK